MWAHCTLIRDNSIDSYILANLNIYFLIDYMGSAFFHNIESICIISLVENSLSSLVELSDAVWGQYVLLYFS